MSTHVTEKISARAIIFSQFLGSDKGVMRQHKKHRFGAMVLGLSIVLIIGGVT